MARCSAFSPCWVILIVSGVAALSGGGIKHDLKGSEIKTLLIIGETGTGKSSLANKIAGEDEDSETFPVSGDPTSCTQNTIFGTFWFGGDKRKGPVNLIDTMGFNDPNNDADIKIIAELVSALKNKTDYVNLFAITVNGQNPRLDESLVAMVSIFEQMFGGDFWKQCIIIFTRMHMDKRSLKNRGKPDDVFAKDYLREVEKKFPNSSIGLQHVFLDTKFEKDDKDELEHFQESMDKLHNVLVKAPKLMTKNVKTAETENAKLRKANKEQEQEMEELKRQLEKERKEKERMQKENQKGETWEELIKKKLISVAVGMAAATGAGAGLGLGCTLSAIIGGGLGAMFG